MSRPRTLLQLRTRVRALADTGPDTTVGRWTTSAVNTLINESWQDMRELVSDNGHQLYLKNATGTLTAGPVAGMSFGTLTMPADCISIYGVDITISPTDIRTLFAVGFEDRNQYRDAYGGATGIPIGFHIYNVGVESGASVTQGTIAIVPAPDRAYPYTIWYLPAWVDITSDTNVFDGIAGFDDWVAWHTVLKIAAADADMQQVAAIATQERQKAEAQMLKRANSVQRVGPARRSDMASRERSSRSMSFWRRPGS